MLTKEQIEQTLKNLYNREQWKNMLFEIFSGQNAIVKWEQGAKEVTLGNKSAAYRAKNLFQLGTIELSDGKTIKVFEAEVQNTNIAQNRVGLRSLIRSEIIPGFSDAALAIFHNSEQSEWRFTFMSKWEFPEESGKVIKHETHPKKFTYVLGPLESCRTARDRFYELQAKPGNLSVVMEAFSVSRLSEEFFKDYKYHYNAFLDYLTSSRYRKEIFDIPKYREAAKNEVAEKPIRDFVKRLMGRIVFLYFLQKKGWMQSIWAEPGEIKPDTAFMDHLFQFADKKKDFYSTYLVPLFFDTLNSERKGDSFKAEGKEVGKIPYLNGGLFEKDFKGVEKIEFKNKLFEELFGFFNSYNFTIIEDSPEEREVAVDPEMLGHIFENLIEENKKFGTFYTPKEVVHFMTQEALLLHLSKKLSFQAGSNEWKELKEFVQYKTGNEIIKQYAVSIDAELDALKICDPAIGSGAFPMGLLLEIYQMKLHLYALTNPGTAFIPSEVKEKIIRKSIYGVDIDKGAIDIARLRFWLSLIVDLDQPRPLPNFDYKFMQGDSLKESFEEIPLQLKEEKTNTTQQNLFGEVNEPETFYGYINRQNISLEKLEEELFDAHDEKQKAAKRDELNKIEKAYIRNCIEDKLDELKTRIDNEWADYRNKTAGLNSSQRDKLKEKYQKKVNVLEEEKAVFEEKASLLKRLDVYEKPYFLWHLYFKHVFDAGGFDIVIANPPYGVKVDDALYADSGLGSKDSYGFFIKLAVDSLLKPKGTLVYIVSDTWLTIKTHFELRQLVLKNQLHKVIRLHPDTFGAVVNTCIISLTKIAEGSKAPSPLGEGVGGEVIATDLTNLSTRKNTPEFREKLWHLENYIGEFNERYAVYSYPQVLIHTNSNLPIFTASPKLFALMNDMTCEKEKRKLVDSEAVKEVEIRKIKINGKEVELVRFGDFAEVKHGLTTGDNYSYIFKKENARGTYKIANTSIILNNKTYDKLSPVEKEHGFDEKKFSGKYLLEYDKGGFADIDGGWLPQYYVPTDYYIDWRKTSVTKMKKLIGHRHDNAQYYFKKGITFSSRGIYSPTFRLNHPGPFDKESSCIFLKNDSLIDEVVGILNSRFIKFIFRNYIIHTVSTEVDTIKEMIVFIEGDDFIKDHVQKIIIKQKENLGYSYFENEQKEIDRIVYELYGLNEEDIQEVEYWWARRYPKLARFADTKPRLSVKDRQELQARLTETIARGENKYCEFKSSLRLDVKKGTVEKYIEHTAFKNIAAFLNSEGGTLIVGVDDEKNILGLETTDFPTFRKSTPLSPGRGAGGEADEWSKHLDNLIQNYIGNKFHHYLKTKFIPLDGKTVVAIEVEKSSEPVWLNKDGNQEFYIRRTASAIQLNGKEAVEYIQEHWKK